MAVGSIASEAMTPVHPIAMALHGALMGGHAITIHPLGASVSAHAPSLGHVSMGGTPSPGPGVSISKLAALGGNKFHTNRFKLG